MPTATDDLTLTSGEYNFIVGLSVLKTNKEIIYFDAAGKLKNLSLFSLIITFT